MLKNWKTILWIGIPVVVLLIIFLVNFFGRPIYSTTQSSGEMFGIAMDTAGIAPKTSKSLGVMNVREEMAYDRADESNAVGVETTERLIIKTGDISMVVEDVKGSVQTISDYAKANNGFVVSSNVYKQGVGLSGRITIRIPSEYFDQKVEDIKQMGDVTSESVNGQDVTEEYVDLGAQMKNLKATETQFLEIMKRAYKIEDVLAVQRELSSVRDRIERIEGRMKYLRESASLSTLNINLSTDPDMLPAVDDADKWKPFGVVKNAFRSLLSLTKGLANFVIWLIVYIPLWIFIGLVVWVVVRVVRKKRNPNI